MPQSGREGCDIFLEQCFLLEDMKNVLFFMRKIDMFMHNMLL